MTREDLYQAFCKALESTVGSKLVATGGTKIINDTTPTTVEANSIIALTDTIISVCGGSDGTGIGVVDFVATYKWATIPAGTLLIAPSGFKIKNITLTSGSVAVYS